MQPRDDWSRLSPPAKIRIPAEYAQWTKGWRMLMAALVIVALFGLAWAMVEFARHRPVEPAERAAAQRPSSLTAGQRRREDFGAREREAAQERRELQKGEKGR